MTIKFSCTKCNRGFSVPDISAGSTGKCKCGAQVTVPKPAPNRVLTPSSASSERKAAWTVGVSVLVLVSLATSVYLLKTQDTWERDNGPRLAKLVRDAEALEKNGELEAALKKYEEVTAEAGSRVIKDKLVRADVQTARDHHKTLAETLRELQRQKAEAEARSTEMRKAAELRLAAYKEAAGHLGDEILRVLSAVEAGINIMKYGEMLQTLNFECNKFALRCAQEERDYPSYKDLDAAVQCLRRAGEYWTLGIQEDGYEESASALMKEEWVKAAELYKRAMTSLSSGK